jgi:hypothetical protein
VAPRCWQEADFVVQEEAPEGWDHLEEVERRMRKRETLPRV